jgi:hypothetical protein
MRLEAAAAAVEGLEYSTDHNTRVNWAKYGQAVSRRQLGFILTAEFVVGTGSKVIDLSISGLLRASHCYCP